jgi:outer membrane protein OmpA-like peptidoglycan-associated protein
MLALRLLAFALSGLLLTAGSGCNNKAKVAEYATKAQEVVTKYSPQVADLQPKVSETLARVNAIPDTVPGAAEQKSQLASGQETIAKLQALLASLPGRVTTAVENRKTEEADAALASATQELDAGLSSLQSTVASADTQIAELEAKAKEMAGFTKTLSSGFELHGALDGLESQLVAFLEDNSKPIDENAWLTCDRIAFQGDTPELDIEQSQEQITNIAEMLKAYPTAKLQIGGFTDNTGTPTAAKALSQKRAQAVVAAVEAAGVAKGRLVAKGYGQEHPVCPANDTEECKAQNRRIAVNVRAR